jgi:hypothetical protein
MVALNQFNIDLGKSYKNLNFPSKIIVKILITIYQYVNEFLKKKIRGLILNEKFLINYLNHYKKTFNPKRFILQEILKLKKDNFILIHMGSGSGQETFYLLNKIKNTIIYSVEFFKVIINYQRKNLNLRIRNKKFFKIKLYQKNFFYELYKKNKIKQIYFSSSSLQFATPYFIKEFFASISRIDNSEILIYEPIVIKNKLIQDKYKNNFLVYSHNYKRLAKENNLKILKEKILFRKKNKAVYYGHFKNI